MPNEREQKIRAKAYELWEAAGRPEDREMEHWAEAERLVDAQAAAPTASPTAPKPRRKSAAPGGAPEAEPLKPARKTSRTPKRPPG